MKGIFGLGLVLSGFWLINSGDFKPLLLILGAFSIIVVITLVRRMEKIDGENFPLVMPTWRLAGYLAWMTVQIIKSNIDVALRILRGPSSISQSVVKVPVSQKTETGKVLFANSITMTPGTVTLAVHDDHLVVHALTAEAAEELLDGEMDRRVTALEKG